jgi:hypothetical protein
MRKAFAILAVLLLLASSLPMCALAQDDNCTEDDCEDCEDCESCRTNNFYYILVTGIIIFLVFFYLRNRKPKEEKPSVKAEKTSPPEQEK